MNHNKNLNVEARDHATSTGHYMKWDHFKTLARGRESRIANRVENRDSQQTVNLLLNVTLLNTRFSPVLLRNFTIGNTKSTSCNGNQGRVVQSWVEITQG